jgi:hypothetical protein
MRELLIAVLVASLALSNPQTSKALDIFDRVVPPSASRAASQG